jgi:hypothetical protein
MLLALMPLIVKLISVIIDALLKNKDLTDKNKEILIKIRESLRLIEISNVKKMNESESQIEAGVQVWADRKAEKDKVK